MLAAGACALAYESGFEDQGSFAEWKTAVGEWRVEEGVLLQPDAGLHRAITFLPTKGHSDIDISVRFRLYPDGEGVKAPGLVYRASTDQTYYYIHYDAKNKQVVWVRSEPGKEWTDARRHRPYEISVDEWHTARVVCRGDRHEVYLDGELLFTEQDDTIKSGVVALRTGQGKVAFDDLKIEGTEVPLETSFQVFKAPFVTVCRDAGAGAYEAFPDVCQTEDGELLCVFYAGYGHVSHPNEKLPRGARIALVRSRDGGETWSEAETVVDTEIDDRDPSITCLANGDLLVTYMTYDPNRRPTHEVFVVRSTDGGKTWREPQGIETPFEGCEAISEPVRELSDGRLLMPIYGALAKDKLQDYVSAVSMSNDGGKTWGEPVMIGSDEFSVCEPSVVELPDKSLYMMFRPTMTWSRSADGGQTWTEPRKVGFSGDAPYLLLTSKGILLCGFRYHPEKATAFASSTDFGQTWSEVTVVDRVIGGYPSMTELADGRVLFVYYTEGGGSDIRCVWLEADEEGVRVLARE